MGSIKGKSIKKGQLFNLRAFSSDVLVFSLGNVLLLTLGFIQLLIIPKYLSVESFGFWQLFVLYASYVGILHLGFINGVHVRWAGKELSQVGNEIRIAFRFLLLGQVFIIIPLGLLLYFLLQPPFQWIGLMISIYAFIVNLGAFFSWTAMAISKFKLLTTVNVGRGLVFLALLILLLSSGYLDYHYVIFAYLTAFLLASLALAFWFRKYLWGKMPSLSSLWAYGRESINIGIFVLLGNFVVVLFLTIDRLMVNSFFLMKQFAIYAFAFMVAMVAYAFIQTVSQVFFPYLSGATPALRTRAYQLGKPAIILAWAALLAIYFPLTRLIEFYLPHYVASLPIIQILLGTVGFGSLIKILHVNYYMVYRKQRQYFLWGITALALSVMLNLLAIRVFGTLEAVAIATFISFVIWYIINGLSLKSVVEESNKELWRGLAILASYLAAFWLASFLADWFVARMLIYIGFFLLVSWLFMSSDFKRLVTVANNLRTHKPNSSKGDYKMGLYSKLRDAIHNPKGAILYVALGQSNYNKVKLELKSIRQYSQIKPQSLLETYTSKCTDINEHLITLYMLTKQLKLSAILELGIRTGESTIVLLLAAKEIGGTVTSVDIMDCPEAISKVDSLGLSDRWHFIKGDDLEVEWNNPIDHLFIDTSHTYVQTLKELQRFEPLVAVGGIITLHDIIAPPGVAQAINDYLIERKDLQLYKYFNNNGLAVIFKGECWKKK